jgi:hypothetical protein
MKMNRKDQRHPCEGYTLSMIKRERGTYIDVERKEFESFQHHRGKYVRPFMKEVIPNMYKQGKGQKWAKKSKTSTIKITVQNQDPTPVVKSAAVPTSTPLKTSAPLVTMVIVHQEAPMESPTMEPPVTPEVPTTQVNSADDATAEKSSRKRHFSDSSSSISSSSSSSSSAASSSSTSSGSSSSSIVHRILQGRIHSKLPFSRQMHPKPLPHP